jgi:peptidoglycan hydrolase-like protein with peptidoglycan-binding domain
MAQNPRKQVFRLMADRLAPNSAAPDQVYTLQTLLGRYGYLHGAYAPGCYDETTRRAVSQFQSFYHLYPDEDGVCDQETLSLLNQRRCGVPDPSPAHRSATGRLAPFVTVGAKWPSATLGYQFLNATPDLALERQRTIVREAFQRWSAVCALQFREVAGNETPNLPIAFHHGSHGDGYPFDEGGGADGNTLAHAFFPPPAGGTWAGSLHFDEFEQWKDQPGGAGIRLYNVALHEIGHLLGLAHSQDTTAIMYAYYGEDRNDLRADDIAGIQSLYGAAGMTPVAIAPGQRISGHLPQTNAEVRYQLTLQNKVLLRLDGPEEQDFDLYVRYGAPAGMDPGQYDAVSYGVTADELITIADPRAGTYYILVHSYRGAGSYTLEVDLA